MEDQHHGEGYDRRAQEARQRRRLDLPLRRPLPCRRPYIDAATGKTKYRVRIADTRREADRILADTIRDREAGLDLTTITVEAFLAKWLKTQRPPVKASTLLAHEAHIRLYINPIIGKLPVAKQSPRPMSSRS